MKQCKCIINVYDGGDIILKSKRKQIIIDKINNDGFVTVDTLIDLLGISESTVRRDLDELECERKLYRIHGGAEKLNASQEELSNVQKAIKNVKEKKEIVKAANEFINDGDVIFIDAGTTNEMLINRLINKNITVVTNSINHANMLLEKNVKTIVVGGFIKKSTNANIGHMAIEQIEKLNFDKAFVGMNGIDDKFLTTPDIEEAAVKKSIIENARETYILADCTKIGKNSFAKVENIEKVTIITNKINNKLMDIIKKKAKVVEV